MEYSHFTEGRGQNDETVVLLGSEGLPPVPPVVVTEGTLGASLPSFVRRHATGGQAASSAVTATLTAATPVASPTAATEMEPLLATVAQNSSYENGFDDSRIATDVTTGQWVAATNNGHHSTVVQMTGAVPPRLPKPSTGERRSRKGSRAPQPPQPSGKMAATPTNAAAAAAATAPKKANGAKAKEGPPQSVQRPCQAHSFHTEAAEVQKMEKELLSLLSDFNSGKLRAFGHGCSMEEMESIRDQQESLAKLHFDLGGKQDLSAPLTEDGIRMANENMDRLMTHLERLSVSIGKLDPAKMHGASTSSGQEDQLPTYRRPSTYPVKADQSTPEMNR